MKTNKRLNGEEERMPFRSDEVQDLKRCGHGWMATCPKCGTHHLSVNLEKGLFHCFYAGCGFGGMFDDIREERKKTNRKKEAEDAAPPRYLKHVVESDCEIFQGGYQETMERNADMLSYLNKLDLYS